MGCRRSLAVGVSCPGRTSVDCFVMRVAVVGAGAVGRRVVRNLVADPSTTSVTVTDPDPAARAALTSAGVPSSAVVPDPRTVDAVVICAPPDAHPAIAATYADAGRVVISTADDLDVVRELLALDRQARQHDTRVMVGAGLAPGVSCLLARLAARGFDQVDEIHVAKVGTGGPACARQHHRALQGQGFDYRDGAWLQRPGGSGRELIWFPSPVDGHDCYRGSLADVELLVPAFPELTRATARMAATRRDRFTMRLPMLRNPHPEGLVGAVRVEVRGYRRGAYDMEVLGVAAPPAMAAASMAVTALRWALSGRVPNGAGGLAEVDDSVGICRDLMSVGLRFERFEGLSTARP